MYTLHCLFEINSDDQSNTKDKRFSKLYKKCIDESTVISLL